MGFVPNEAEKLLLDLINSNATAFWVGLYREPLTIDADTDFADLNAIECNSTGYTPVALSSPGTSTIDGSGAASATFPVVEFEVTSTGSEQYAYGWFVSVNYVTWRLVAVGAFDSAKSFYEAGDWVKVTLTDKLQEISEVP